MIVDADGWPLACAAPAADPTIIAADAGSMRLLIKPSARSATSTPTADPNCMVASPNSLRAPTAHPARVRQAVR